jgi:hypothetical protein
LTKLEPTFSSALRAGRDDDKWAALAPTFFVGAARGT